MHPTTQELSSQEPTACRLFPSTISKYSTSSSGTALMASTTCCFVSATECVAAKLQDSDKVSAIWGAFFWLKVVKKKFRGLISHSVAFPSIGPGNNFNG